MFNLLKSWPCNTESRQLQIAGNQPSAKAHDPRSKRAQANHVRTIQLQRTESDPSTDAARRAGYDQISPIRWRPEKTIAFLLRALLDTHAFVKTIAVRAKHLPKRQRSKLHRKVRTHIRRRYPIKQHADNGMAERGTDAKTPVRAGAA